MSLYVYALTREMPRGRLGRGIFGERIESHAFSSFVAIVGEMDAVPEVAEASLRGHDEVVRRIAARVPAVLPMRFGMTADSTRALEANMTGRAVELTAALARVEGCEQMTLRIFVDRPRAPDVQDASSGPGARYLRARAVALFPAEITDLRAELAPYVKDERAEAHDAKPLVASVYHLVPRVHRDAYLAALDSACRALEGARVVRSGPWPPYAFAEAP